jgi:hypothetical protein
MNPIDQLKAVLCDPSGKCCIDGSDEDRAIIDRALQELAKPEQEFYPDWNMLKPYYERIKELEAQLAKRDVTFIDEGNKQEPVAWMTNSEHEYSFDYKFNWLQTPLHNIPLYTAPPRKEWVGLTDDEIHKIIDDCTPDNAEQDELNDFARAVRFAEFKLKEKNSAL